MYAWLRKTEKIESSGTGPSASGALPDPRLTDRHLAQRPRRRRALALVLPLALLLAAAVAGCAGTGVVKGSGELVTKEYESAGIARVRVDDAFVATVTRGDVADVTVTVDDNLVRYLRVTREGDALHIGFEGLRVHWATTQRARITLPTLRGLEAADGSRVAVQGFDSQGPLDLRVLDGAKADLTGIRAGEVGLMVSDAARLSGELEAQVLRGQVSDAAEVSLEGSASTGDFRVIDISRLDLSAFSLRDADLRLLDGARGAVRASGTVNVQASDGSRLEYFGSARLGRVQVSDGADVVRGGS